MDLARGANAPLPTAQLRVQLSWTHTAAVDVDVSGLLCAGRRVRCDDDFVFYNQPSDSTGALQHLGKAGDLTPGSAVTDVLEVDLVRLDAGVDLLVIAASLDAAPDVGFGVLSAAGLTLTVHVVGDVSPLAVVPLADLSTQTALVVAEVYRRGGGWKVRAVAQGYDDGLTGLARDFGVHVDAPGSDGPGADAPGAGEPPPTPAAGPSWDWRDPPLPVGYGS